MSVRVAVALLWLAGCGSVGAQFEPYPRSTPHAPMLSRAVMVERGDVPALARAGGIILGSITASGNAFTPAESLEDIAAHEAARRGGTHLVLESSIPKRQSPTEPLHLRFMVVRLSDPTLIAQLPPRLQPRRGVNYQDRLAVDWTEVDHEPPKPLDPGEPRATNPPVVDGSQLKPLR